MRIQERNIIKIHRRLNSNHQPKSRVERKHFYTIPQSEEIIKSVENFTIGNKVEIDVFQQPDHLGQFISTGTKKIFKKTYWFWYTTTLERTLKQKGISKIAGKYETPKFP